MDQRVRCGPAMLVVALVAFVAAAAGIGATDAQHVAVDETQYLLTVISLAEDGDLDIADELSDRRWTAFSAVEPPRQTAVRPDGRRLSPHDPLLPVLLAGPMAAGGWVGAKLALAVWAGLLAAVTLRVAVRRFGVPVGTAAVGSERPARRLRWRCTASRSTPLAVYGQQVYPELPAATLVMVGVAALLEGYGRGAGAASAAATPRNLLGFKDGTANLDATDPELMDRHVWVAPGAGEPDWVSGAPLGRSDEFDDPAYDEDPDGTRIALEAHIRRANPRTPETEQNRILRRGFSFTRGFDGAGRLDQGLAFVSYQRSLATGFLAVQDRLSGEALEEYVQAQGGGFFFALPGVRDPSRFLADALVD